MNRAVVFDKAGCSVLLGAIGNIFHGKHRYLCGSRRVREIYPDSPRSMR